MYLKLILTNIRAILALLMLSAAAVASADYPMAWNASTIVNTSTTGHAPYYISSRSGGFPIAASGIYETASLENVPDSARRFNFNYGFEGVAAVNFHRSVSSKASVWIQQLWGEISYRSLFLSIGQRDQLRSLFDSSLSVGDFVISDNSRPIPQFSIGFRDFQPIPFTKKNVLIRGEISYGKFTDSKWLKDHYNYYDSFITTGAWFHYKSLYLASNPDFPFAGIIGFQHAAQFGGTQLNYSEGKLTSEIKSPVKFRDFLDVFFQIKGKSGYTDGDQAYYNGNHLGSWDLKLRYRFSNGSKIIASAQLPWEDGSGIGKLNAWDGIWAIRWESPSSQQIIKAIEISYIDFMNQSGPNHWAPGDHPGTQIPGQATGADDYYNNYFYDGWANYGMAIGTPFIKSPAYNSDGYLRFTDNRLRGFQIGAEGRLPFDLDWRILLSWRKAAGTPLIPSDRKREAFSAAIFGCLPIHKVPGLSLMASAAFDAGSLYQAGFGIKASVEYSGIFAFKTAKK